MLGSIAHGVLIKAPARWLTASAERGKTKDFVGTLNRDPRDMALAWKVEEEEMGSERHGRSSKMFPWARDLVFRKSPKQRAAGPSRVCARVGIQWASGSY